jgi:hypothetical protein
MRGGIVLAAALTVMTVMSATALSAGGARADGWCGYATHENAVIECGYTTADQCTSAVGKGGMCFVDPDTAFNLTHATLVNGRKVAPAGKALPAIPG